MSDGFLTIMKMIFLVGIMVVLLAAMLVALHFIVVDKIDELKQCGIEDMR